MVRANRYTYSVWYSIKVLCWTAYFHLSTPIKLKTTGKISVCVENLLLFLLAFVSNYCEKWKVLNDKGQEKSFKNLFFKGLLVCIIWKSFSREATTVVITFMPNVRIANKLRLENGETVILDCKTLTFTITSLRYVINSLTYKELECTNSQLTITSKLLVFEHKIVKSVPQNNLKKGELRICRNIKIYIKKTATYFVLCSH
jgi:hypothetical protein